MGQLISFVFIGAYPHHLRLKSLLLRLPLAP